LVKVKMPKTEEGTGPQSKEEEIRKRLGELLEPQIVDILTNQITIKSIKAISKIKKYKKLIYKFLSLGARMCK